nr:hypothetical protein Iba_chr04dCG10220 [Ipomoea batatas]
MQESLGYVDIHLRDVVYNGRMNEDMLIYMLIYGGSLLRFVEIKQRRQDLGALEMRGKLHRPDLAVEEQLVGGARRSSAGVTLARQPGREVEFEGGIRRHSGGGGLRVNRSAGNETSGGKHEVHGTSGSNVVKSTVRLAAAWARGGAHIRSGATAVDVVGKHGCFLAHRRRAGEGSWSFRLFHYFV